MKPNDRALADVVLAVATIAAVALVAMESGPGAAMRYVVCVGCIIGNGCFLYQLVAKPRSLAMLLSTVLMLALNVAGAFLLDRIGLLVGFWIPGGVGLALAFAARVSGSGGSGQGRRPDQTRW